MGAAMGGRGDAVLRGVLRQGVGPLARAVYRPIVEGRENVPGAGAVILAANHRSFFDSVVIPLVAGRPVSFLAKAEYFTEGGPKGHLKRAFFTAIEAVPIERGDHRGALESQGEGDPTGDGVEGVAGDEVRFDLVDRPGRQQMCVLVGRHAHEDSGAAATQ